MSLISLEHAIDLIAEGPAVHTYRSTGAVLLGADWDRPALLDAMRASPRIEIGGPACRAMNHGVVIFTPGALFIACRPGADYARFESHPAQGSQNPDHARP